jgi:hypothetical protein
VALVTGRRVGDQGSGPSRSKIFFLYSTVPSPLILLSNGHRASLMGVIQPGREADHSSPSSAEVKNGGAILLFPISPHGIVLN